MNILGTGRTEKIINRQEPDRKDLASGMNKNKRTSGVRVRRKMQLCPGPPPPPPPPNMSMSKSVWSIFVLGHGSHPGSGMHFKNEHPSFDKAHN